MLKKPVLPGCARTDCRKCLFCAQLRKILARNPLLKVKISISGAYFSAVETMADFFNRIGRLLTIIRPVKPPLHSPPQCPDQLKPTPTLPTRHLPQLLHLCRIALTHHLPPHPPIGIARHTRGTQRPPTPAAIDFIKHCHNPGCFRRLVNCK